MANDVTQNPLVIDSAGAGDVIGTNQRADIVAFWWDGAGVASGNSVVVTDTAGKKLWGASVVTSLSNAPTGLSLPNPLRVKGIKVPTLAAGVLYIYLAGGNSV
jgi:hypothetical protein